MVMPRHLPLGWQSCRIITYQRNKLLITHWFDEHFCVQLAIDVPFSFIRFLFITATSQLMLKYDVNMCVCAFNASEKLKRKKMGPSFLIWCSKDKFTVIWANVGIITTAITWNHWGFSTGSLSFVQSVALFVFTMCIHNHYRYRHFLRHFHSCSSVSLSLSLSLRFSGCCLQCCPLLKSGKTDHKLFHNLASYTKSCILFQFELFSSLIFVGRLLGTTALRLSFSKSDLKNEYIHANTLYGWIYIRLGTNAMRYDTMRCDAEQWTVSTVQESRAYTQ